MSVSCDCDVSLSKCLANPSVQGQPSPVQRAGSPQQSGRSSAMFAGVRGRPVAAPLIRDLLTSTPYPTSPIRRSIHQLFRFLYKIEISIEYAYSRRGNWSKVGIVIVQTLPREDPKSLCASYLSYSSASMQGDSHQAPSYANHMLCKLQFYHVPVL